MGKRAISFIELTCERCGYKWIPETSKEPKACAGCNSPYWNKSRRAKTKPKAPVKAPIKPVKARPVVQEPEPGTPEWEAQRKKQSTPIQGRRGRGGIFSTAARRDVRVRRSVRRPVQRRPTQREIDNAGIGGAI